jgi:hypothetical protein
MEDRKECQRRLMLKKLEFLKDRIHYNILLKEILRSWEKTRSLSSMD